MARRRDHLPHAPITEAVIDIRVRSTSFTAQTLEELRSSFIADFPMIENQRSYQGLIRFDTDGVSQLGNDLGIVGLLCRSEQRQEAVQVGAAGYAFSKLRPYTSWDGVVDSARHFWSMYALIVQPEMITRLGVRYINQFGVPRQQSLDRYLTNWPRVPENVDPSNLRSSLNRVSLRDERRDLSAHVVQVTELSDAGANVIIDTDCFRGEEEFNPLSETFWGAFADLREMKNQIFFGSVTDLAVEDFE
jgi:uncharacterized protein (TIGR04255 family)